MNRALITFKPLEPYFFGSEQTHGDEGANYFAVSNRAPQQSTLCGVMRHLLYEAVDPLARGKNSFNPENAAENDYGRLLGLSPLFLCHDGENGRRFFLRQSIDRHGDNQPFIAQAASGDEALTPYATDWHKGIVWQGLDPKKSGIDAWVSQDGTECIDADDIFLERTRPGITKKPDEKRRKREAGFYKQTACQLESGWSFAVLADLADDVKVADLDGYCLPIGGEKTVFSIGATTEPRKFDDIFDASMFYPAGHAGLPRLVLVSDTMIPPDAFVHLAGGITESTDFRHIRTHENVREYGRLRRLKPNDKQPEDPTQLIKSIKYSLLARGSVLVCSNDTQLKLLKESLEETPAVKPWRKIGFNHFITFNTKHP